MFCSQRVLGIFKIALRLRDQHVFVWQSAEILNVFNTSTLKQTFSKFLFKKLEYRFWVENIKMESALFPHKLPYQKSILRQIEWWVQNEAITKNGVLPITTLFFWFFCFSLKTSYKELIWCTNHPNTQLLLSVSTEI